MFNVFFIEDFFRRADRETILQYMASAQGGAAEVYGLEKENAGRVDGRVRSAQRLATPDDLRGVITKALTDALPVLSRHYGVPLTTFEEPQLLRYGPGDFFVAHQDGNTPLIRDDSMHRRVSVSVFINAPSLESGTGDYDGGSLVLHGPYPHFDKRYVVPAIAGSLAAFPSETTHEVTPVTQGHRYAMVTWYR